MQLTDIGLHEVIDGVWTQMLGYDIEPTVPPVVFEDTRHLTGSVAITGDWDVMLLIEVPEALALDLASTMFAMDQADLSQDDVFDTLGEMANMVGGNVKGLIPGNTQLSLPTISEGRGYQVHVPGSELLVQLAYRVGEWTMETRLVGRAR